MKKLRNQLFVFFTAYLILFNGTVSAISAFNPIFERDSNGNAVAVWLEVVSDTISIRYNTFISGSWGSAQDIFTGGTNTQYPVLGVNAVSGTDISAVLVWGEDSGTGNTALFTAMLPSTSGSWTSANQISMGANETVNDDYSVRVHSDGTVVVIYTTYDSGTSDQVVKSITSTIDNSNSFSSPETISD